MSPMLVEISKVMGAEYTHPLWWCLSLGACLGGNLTIIGAAANVVVSEQAAKDGHPISFMRFMKYGSVTVLISLILSTVLYLFKIFTLNSVARIFDVDPYKKFVRKTVQMKIKFLN